MNIKLIKFRDDLIKPSRAHYNDAGIDCYAQEDITLDALYGRVSVLYPTARVASFPTLIPLGFGVLTQIGTIDSGYRGEIKAVLINLTGEPIKIKKGDKICQIVIEPVILSDFVENLGDERGEGGFGSTGR